MISSDQLKTALVAAGFSPACITLPHANYSLPDVLYVLGLGDRFYQFLWNAKLHYVVERFDCSEFSLQAVAHARLEHANYGTTGTGLAFGIAAGIRGVEGHCVNFAAHRIDGQIVLKFYEPQPNNNTCLLECSPLDAWLWCYC